MKWPWQRQQERHEAALIRAAQQGAALALAEVSRQAPPIVDLPAVASPSEGKVIADAVRAVLAGSSPMMGVPTQNNGSRYPLYGMDYPLQYATPQPPTRRPGSIITTQTLRQLADTYDVLRSCINHLKREVAAVPIEFVAKDAKDDRASTQRQVAEARAFFSAEGGLGGVGFLRSDFEGEMYEEVLVIGAAPLYYHPTYGGLPYEVLTVPADTIRPVVDAYGWPGIGEIWLEQWIQGVQLAGYTRDQMSYRGLPTHKKAGSPYYQSSVEWLILVIQSALKADEWNRTWLTDGNVPDMLIGAPDTWTPEQIERYALYFDALLAGNSLSRQKAKIVPGGLSVKHQQTRKDADFQEFELWLLRRTCALMGVQPASIGFAGEQYKVSQQDSMKSTSAFGVGVLLDYRKSQYDDILRRMQLFDIECQNVTALEEKAQERATRNSALVSGGIKTPNEARQDEGLEKIEGGDTLFIPTTLRPIEQALEPPPAPVLPGTQPGTGGKPEKVDPDKANTDQQRAELALWEKKALRRLKDRGNAEAPFTSDVLSVVLRVRIGQELAACRTADEVRAIFRASAPEDDAEFEVTDWAARVMNELEALHATSA